MNVIHNGYLHRPGAPYPLPIGTISFDRWWRAKGQKVRVIIPDGSARWVGAKKIGPWVVLQKRVNKELFQISCGRPYSLQFNPPDWLEKQAGELAQRITAKVGNSWGNRFPAGDFTPPAPPARSPSPYPQKLNTREKREYDQLLENADLECLILELGQGHLFDPQIFFDFLEGEYSLAAIKKAIGQQRAVGNILRRRDGYYEVAKI